jgi:RNA polymerase sigma factor (sigma-70 family)
MEYTETSISHVASLVQEDPAFQAAFIPLYDAYFSRVYNYIRYRSGDADTADDLTAVVFEKALYNFHRYQPERAPFSAWLFAIARNIVNMHLRHQRRQSTTPLESLPDQPGDDGLPEANFISIETSEELLASLRTLDERERDLLSLKFAAHLTNRRIAEISRLSEANVGVIIYRALKKLRAQLASYE